MSIRRSSLRLVIVSAFLMGSSPKYNRLSDRHRSKGDAQHSNHYTDVLADDDEWILLCLIQVRCFGWLRLRAQNEEVTTLQ